MKKHVIIIIALLLVFQKAYSQTNINAPIYASTTWTASGSPYIVSNGVIIFDGATLTIEPGVVVQFNDNVSIELRGKLRAIGTSSSPITFTSSSSSPNMGIYVGFKVIGYVTTVGSVTNQITMAHCNVLYASNFVDLAASAQAPFNFTNCYFYNNNYIDMNSADYGPMNFDSCKFESNGNGPLMNTGNGDLYVTNSTFINNVNGTSQGHISNCKFSGHSGLAVYCYGSLQNCEIYNNNIGVESDNHRDVTVTDNYIHDNSIGVKIDRFWNDPSILFIHNKICHNTTWNIEYGFSYSGNLSQNCWCSTDSAFIRSKIRDGYVNTSYGLVTFLPTDSIGCPIIADSSSTASVNNQILSKTSVKTYPNPLIENCTFEFSFVQTDHYELYVTDQLGRIIKSFDNIENGKINFSRDNISSGVYYYKLIDNGIQIAQGKLSIL